VSAHVGADSHCDTRWLRGFASIGPPSKPLHL